MLQGAVYAATYLETPVAVKETHNISEVEMNLHSGAALCTAVLLCIAII